MLEPFITDHLLSPALTTVKQFSLAPFQVVQKPSVESFQVPSPLAPPPPPFDGSRFILLSAVNVILNLTLDVVAAVNGWPLKNVVAMASGASFAAGAARTDMLKTTTEAIPVTTPAIGARIAIPQSDDSPPP